MLKITLGPRAGLHTGYHGALLNYPPPHVMYSSAAPLYCFHTYHNPSKDFSSLNHFSVGEYHYYTGKHSFVHNADYPVINKGIPWIVDTSDLTVYLLNGSSVRNPQYARWLRKTTSKRLMLERAERMLELYNSDECLALLFHSKQQRKRNIKMCEYELPPSFRPQWKKLFRKAQVCYPAQACLVSPRELKARTESKLKTVLFGARFFEDKGGASVLRLYEKLLKRSDVNLVYVGPVPP